MDACVGLFLVTLRTFCYGRKCHSFRSVHPGAASPPPFLPPLCHQGSPAVSQTLPSAASRPVPQLYLSPQLWVSVSAACGSVEPLLSTEICPYLSLPPMRNLRAGQQQQQQQQADEVDTENRPCLEVAVKCSV
ncbi:hypothetical protein E2C01_027633 [Portunus trituberculatus]|uniref:Uncharacterized protein n=1 Tax=Portunus trituberculatus TaxID=210409 RepID=A0A5B7EM55_PORTR|nr:hypothetical protein [Portunus trituberculatus]